MTDVSTNMSLYSRTINVYTSISSFTFQPKYLSLCLQTPVTFEDPEQKEFEYKMSQTIEAMPAEVKDRFKALKVLYVSSDRQHIHASNVVILIR